MKPEWLPAFETFAVTVELEKDNFIRLKFLAMTLAFAESCECTKRWFVGEKFEMLKATFPRAKDVSALCLLFFLNQPFVRATNWSRPDARCF